MEREFVSYEQALALAGLGVYIPPPCYTVYRKYPNMDAVLLVNPDSMETLDIVAPLKQQVFRCFREKYGSFLLSNYGRVPHFTIIQNLILENQNMTYEEAESVCIDRLIELVKQQDNGK